MKLKISRQMLALSLCYIFIFPAAVTAGDKGYGAGNGEFLHACKKGKNDDDYKVLEIWDFYEARKANPKNYEVQREWDGTVYEQAIKAINKMAKVNASYASLIRNEFEFIIQPQSGVPFVDTKGNDLLEDLEPGYFEQGWMQLVQGPLTPTNDTDSDIYTDKGQNCEKLQLVNYPEYLNPALDPSLLSLDQKIKIDRTLWKMTKEGLFLKGYLLHKTDKAAILLHEAIYKVERDYFNALDSRHTREVVALLFQKNPVNFEKTLTAKLIPSNQLIFGEENFNYESVRKFFHQKGKFSLAQLSDIVETQWDIFGSLTRDGRNSIEAYYTPEKSQSSFAQGRRPKLIFMKGGEVYADSIFKEEVCQKNSSYEQMELGCSGKYIVDSNSVGTVGIGQIPSGSFDENYQFPSISCKLSYSKNVLICESLVKNGETFFTMFYRQTRKSDANTIAGSFRLVSELSPHSNVMAAANGNFMKWPKITITKGQVAISGLNIMAKGFSLDVYQSLNEDFYQVGIVGPTNGHMKFDLPFSGLVNRDNLQCFANPLLDTLVCSFTMGGTVTPVRLVFQTLGF